MTESKHALLRTAGLTVHYGKLAAVRNADISVGRGEIVVVVGQNSAGKTTLLTAASMRSREQSVSGGVLYRGREITSLSTGKRREEGIRYVPEFRGVFPSLTVVENFRIATDALGLSWEQEYESAAELFPEVFRDRSASTAGTLSGGEQQMLSLARALVGEPALLVLDEPRLGLAVGVTNRLKEAIIDVRDGDVGVLIADQTLGTWGPVCDAVYRIRRGEVSDRIESRDQIAALAEQAVVE